LVKSESPDHNGRSTYFKLPILKHLGNSCASLDALFIVVLKVNRLVQFL
jgi:hypothetical protein